MLRRAVRIEADAAVDHCIVMDRSVIGRGARLRRVIVDQDNHIPAGEVIGHDLARDRERFHVSEGGVVVVPRGYFRAAARA
jgi:glucose-1-phosphate adenylyltransferase